MVVQGTSLRPGTLEGHAPSRPQRRKRRAPITATTERGPASQEQMPWCLDCVQAQAASVPGTCRGASSGNSTTCMLEAVDTLAGQPGLAAAAYGTATG